MLDSGKQDALKKIGLISMLHRSQTFLNISLDLNIEKTRSENGANDSLSYIKA
jgi:hypothetical protein